MTEHYYAVIMAGGGGTRLWPLSRKGRPKQALALVDDRSLFQTAVDRLEGVFSTERILIVTVEEQARLLQAQCPEIPQENFLLEPMPRGTASVVGMAATVLQKRDPEAVMAILTADHLIHNEDGFRELLRTAYAVASDNYLVTLGIAPTHPATGYGYIHQGKMIGTYRNRDVYQVLQFTEKPNKAKAEKMLGSGNYAWNSGMFVWRVKTILDEFSRQMPALTSVLGTIAQSWGTPEESEVLHRVWPTIIPETIDYGIMEKAERVAVIPAKELGWSDVGSWGALFDALAENKEDNVVRGGEHFGLNTKGTLIHAADNPRAIFTIGLEDVIVVDTDDVLLICSKDEAQRVREIVKLLKEERREEYL
ncbi:MAG: hypothetical protein B6243_01050 [Anaerolineaceae bacterium 4572_5.2]|nr:MAG: hypothetical protein B6243_01050 [Anaerolineaceae bacterium 4572_5.2]